jgi:hypothetical protein
VITSAAIQLVQAVSSIVLSSILIYFYSKTADVQQKQANIAEKQSEVEKRLQEIEEARVQPNLVVNEYSIEGNTVQVTLTNNGGAPARDLGLITEIIYPDERDHSQTYRTSPPIPLARSNDEDHSLHNQRAGLSSNESLITFEGEAIPAGPDSNIVSESFTDALGYLPDEASFEVEVEVRYKNILGKPNRVSVFQGKLIRTCDNFDGMSLEEFYEQNTLMPHHKTGHLDDEDYAHLRTKNN